jgi:DNA (cytosine-5)-methyltransferase 1
MVAYYNENDPKTAKWLRQLIEQKLIADGDVDERDIRDVKAEEIRGYTQHHFFAGIGGWSYALRQAGWEDSRPAITGSCPCTPFSSAGKKEGTKSRAHLWPEMFRLIRGITDSQNNPTIFGEQVANAESWFDTLQNDLEREDYATGMVVFPACGIGAPHLRQRLYWFADRMADSDSLRRTRVSRSGTAQAERASKLCETDGAGPTNGFWENPDWIWCRDEKWRPTQSGVEPLVDGVSNRMVKLRGYGNAIVVPQAKEFIQSYMELELFIAKRS